MGMSEEVLNCRLCKDKMIVAPLPGAGNANADIMVVGQNTCQPKCLESGIPFTGGSGILLDKALVVSGLTRDDIWLTNVVKCATVRNQIPSDTMKQNCREFLWKELNIVKPRLVIALGKFASQDFPVGKYRIVNLFHPAYFCYKHKESEFIELFKEATKR